MASNIQTQGSKGGVSGENVTLKGYERKVKEDIKLIHENLNEMLKLLKLEDEKSRTNEEFGLNKMGQAQIDQFEIQIRTANISKSIESLSRIVSELKELTILNDFKSINAQIFIQTKMLSLRETEIESQLTATKDSLFMTLHSLQQEYFSSNYK